MSSSNGFWQDTDFFKGFLTARWRFRQLSFVVLASASVSYRSFHSVGSGAELDSISSLPEVSGAEGGPSLTSPADGAGTSGARSQEWVGGTSYQANNPFSSPVNDPDEEGSQQFFIFRREDVQAPPAKYIAEPSKLDRCFLMCEKESCGCSRLHVRPGAWRARLDTLVQTAPLVCYNEECVMHLEKADITPTAGYYYALGLRAEGMACVFPRICPLGSRCGRREICLFIHLSDDRASVKEAIVADKPLGDLVSNTLSAPVMDILTARSLDTVGDMQMLSKEAFDAMVGQAPQDVLEELLSVSTCRFFDQHSRVDRVLATFPHLPQPLPASIAAFSTVADVLKLTPSEFYSRPLPVEIMNAFEIIRKRSQPDTPFQSVHLEDLDDNSFIPKSLDRILDTARRYAHCSWRRHDPKRPLVTSMITYVNVATCHCGRGVGYSGLASSMTTAPTATSTGQNQSHQPAGKHQTPAAVSPTPHSSRTLTTTTTPAPAPPSPSPMTNTRDEDYCLEYTEDRRERLPAPHGSWCDCPRLWEVAVNYELNTPMGSRCSEQNVMAAIARSGAPTWSVREVVVHGSKYQSEMNPLFPCGVCENMLRKVEKDVRQRYGKHITLFMFDATVPSKVFSLPVREISLRDNPHFLRLIRED